MGGKHGKVGKLFDPSKLKKMFDEYDGDNTGSIQLDELKRVVNDVFLGFSMDKKRKEEALWEYFPSGTFPCLGASSDTVHLNTRTDD